MDAGAHIDFDFPLKHQRGCASLQIQNINDSKSAGSDVIHPVIIKSPDHFLAGRSGEGDCAAWISIKSSKNKSSSGYPQGWLAV